MLDQMKASGESQISLTDPDARAVAAHPKVGIDHGAVFKPARLLWVHAQGVVYSRKLPA